MDGYLDFRISPLHTVVEAEDKQQKLWLKELRDLARGFCGALFVALPLLYTLEMWQRATLLPAWLLLLFVLIAYFANVGYIKFEGYKPEPERSAAWLDALTAMGLGAAGSLVTLLLIGQYTFSTPIDLLARIVLLEMIPTSFGASLAINQLGTRSGYSQGAKQAADDYPQDLRKILATVLGALFFSFNIAPTVEPQLITYSVSWWHVLGTLVFSIFVSALMVFFANFIEGEDKRRGVLAPAWAETVISYLVSLAMSALLLWLFGYFTPGVPLPLAIAWTIMLGYVTTLGGSAGRIVL